MGFFGVWTENIESLPSWVMLTALALALPKWFVSLHKEDKER